MAKPATVPTGYHGSLILLQTCMAPFNRPDPIHWQAASVLAGAPLGALAGGQQPPAMDPGTQRQALASELRSRLLSSASATSTLEHWCAEHRLAVPAQVRAVRVDLQRPAPPAVREALAADLATPLHYRRVQLVCGPRVLSEADNWYRPECLSAAMLSTLERSEAPFGRVVAPLGFVRQTLREQLYWPPRASQDGQDTFFEVHALLRDQQQRPFSYVVETYLPQVLP